MYFGNRSFATAGLNSCARLFNDSRCWSRANLDF